MLSNKYNYLRVLLKPELHFQLILLLDLQLRPDGLGDDLSLCPDGLGDDLSLRPDGLGDGDASELEP
jgi:hypothetical protein